MDIKTYKVSLLASENVGKKTLIKNHLNQLFKENLRKTIGVDFLLKQVEVYGNQNIKLQFWIHSEDKQFEFLLNYQIIGANGIILMYDITNTKSFNRISESIHLIKNVIKDDVPILLIGNKSDLASREK